MINRLSSLCLIYLILFLTGCLDPQLAVKDIIRSVGDKYVPDSRTGVFNVEVREDGRNLILYGETDHQESLEAILDSLERMNISYINNVELLPGQELGHHTWAITNVSVSNLRKAPQHSSELVTQGILGTPVKLLKRKGGWYLVQTPDRYLGWVNSGGIELKTSEEINDFFNSEKIIYTEIYGFSHQEPVADSPVVSDLTLGNVLTLVDSSGNFFKVFYPDGRTGYVNKSESRRFSEWESVIQLTGPNLVNTASRLLGIPYLWGGTSSKAMDCSGFTKTVYFMHGLVLPRDASQQNHVGSEIDRQKQFENLLPGDLLFFGRDATDSTNERVVHVGMWIGDNKFIHASGDVHVSSFDPQSSLFDEYNLNRYLRTNRLIKADQSNIKPVGQVYSGIW
jgi:hypothetical protein